MVQPTLLSRNEASSP